MAGIEHFHSRGQHLCKFIGTKENVCRWKEFNSHRTGLGHQHGRPSIVLIWPPRRHVKTLYNNFGGLIMSSDYVTLPRKLGLNRVWIRCFVANVASRFQLTIIWKPLNNFTVRFVIVEANHRFVLHLRCMVIANLWRFQFCLSLYRLQLARCAMQSRGMAWYHRARCGVIW